MERNPESQPVFLVGMKHTGKSLLAKVVAGKTGRRVIDVDEEIERLHAAESARRLSVRDIYGLDGGKTFGRLETVACSRAAATQNPVIVATGGGLCDNHAACAELDSGMIIALEADPELLFKRIIKRGIPAFMSASTRSEAWEEFLDLFQRRSARYREMADVIVEVHERPPKEVAAELAIRIEEYLHGGK